MTHSSSPFPPPSCGKRSWDHGEQHSTEPEGRGEEKQTTYLYVFIQTCVENTETCNHVTLQPLPLGPPSIRMVSSAVLEFPVSVPRPQSLSQLLSHSWLFFIWGSGYVRGGEGVLPNLRSLPVAFMLFAPRLLFQ